MLRESYLYATKVAQHGVRMQVRLRVRTTAGSAEGHRGKNVALYACPQFALPISRRHEFGFEYDSRCMDLAVQRCGHPVINRGKTQLHDATQEPKMAVGAHVGAGACGAVVISIGTRAGTTSPPWRPLGACRRQVNRRLFASGRLRRPQERLAKQGELARWNCASCRNAYRHGLAATPDAIVLLEKQIAGPFGRLRSTRNGV